MLERGSLLLPFPSSFGSAGPSSETNPQPAVLPAGGRAPTEEARKAAHVVELHMQAGAAARTVVGAFFAVDTFAPGGAVLVGGGARVGGGQPTGLGWAIDTRFEYGGVSRSEGHIAIMAGSAGAALFVGTAVLVSLRMGGGVRLGLARVTGQPYAPDAVRGSWNRRCLGWTDAAAGAEPSLWSSGAAGYR